MSGVFYSEAKGYVLSELDARRNRGYVESRRQKGVYVQIDTRNDDKGTTGYLNCLDNTSLASRYATTTGRPTPSLISVDIEMSGDYGSLKRGVLNVKCYDKKSFESFEQEFMLPGTDIKIKYGRAGVSGPANNGLFEGVVYDYSFKLNSTLGYDCEIKCVAKGSMATELNAMSKLDQDGRIFTSDFEWMNEETSVVNICDVFDYDFQDELNEQEDANGEYFTYNRKNMSFCGIVCPDASEGEPTQKGMVGGNVIYCSLGYIINKLINKDLFKGNAEADDIKIDFEFVCNDRFTVGRAFPYMFSANPMKILIFGGQWQMKYGGTGGWFGGAKDWGEDCAGSSKCALVMDGSDTAKLANILISRDVLRGLAGAGGFGDEGSKCSVNKLLTGLFKEIYNHTGGAYDLTSTEMTADQAAFYGYSGDVKSKMFIVDKNYALGKGARKIEFNATNPSNFDNSTRNVAVTGKVPKDMAAAAFVGGKGVASGKKGAITAAAIKMGMSDSVVDALAMIELMAKLLESRETIHDNGYSGEAISQAKTNLKAYVEGGQSFTEKAKFRKDMYPLNLSATLDGINGIQFGNACKTDLAPSRYYETGGPKICFTVTKTKHKITPNDWTTDVETICRTEP